MPEKYNSHIGPGMYNIKMRKNKHKPDWNKAIRQSAFDIQSNEIGPGYYIEN